MTTYFDGPASLAGVALVTLDSPAAVQRAVATVNGSLDNPILTMPASRGASNAEAEAGGGRREGSRAEVGPDAADGGVGSTAAGPMDGGVGVGGRGLVTGREPGGVGVSAPSAGMRFPAAGSVPLPPTKPLFAAAASMTRPASGSVRCACIWKAPMATCSCSVVALLPLACRML